MSFPLVLSFICLTSATIVYGADFWQEVDFNTDGKINSLDILNIFNYYGCPENCPSPTPPQSEWTSCEVSRFGANIMTSDIISEENGTEVVNLSNDGYSGLVGALNCTMIGEYFPSISDLWEKSALCNSLNCLAGVANPSPTSRCYGQDYDFIAYGPERLQGVPEEEWQNLPWAVQQARQIADQNNKQLFLSFSTKQLLLDAIEKEEYGNDANNVDQVIADLAPYADRWLIQAADELNTDDDNLPDDVVLLSQVYYQPGLSWRNEVERWVNMIKSANPDVEIWIQLAIGRVRIDSNWEQKWPSAELLLNYREWLVNPEHGTPLVDGVFVSSFYSWGVCPGPDECYLDACFQPGDPGCDTVPCPYYPTCDPAGHFIADEQMELAFRCACGGECEGLVPSETPTPTPLPSPTSPPPNNDITLIEEGWSEDKTVTGMTLVPGYYYRIYETSYPCGTQGNHQFMVIDSSMDQNAKKNLMIDFPGGSVGFYYEDEEDAAIPNDREQEYYPGINSSNMLRQTVNYNAFFRMGLSNEYANGVTKKIRDDGNFRLIIPSYCSHDLYYGTGQYSEEDSFYRWGYSAVMDSANYVVQNYNTNKIITYGGSAGASGAFVIGHGLEQNNYSIAGIVMDSMSTDLEAISQSCLNGINVFSNQSGSATSPCCCPELEADGLPSYQVENGWCAAPYTTPCMNILAEKIGFNMGTDEPYRLVDQGQVNVPIFYIWNTNDAGNNAHYLYSNLHTAIRQQNPGGNSIPCRVCLPNTDPNISTCIEDDEYQPLGTCNVHVPSGSDNFPELIDQVYSWITQRVGS